MCLFKWRMCGIIKHFQFKFTLLLYKVENMSIFPRIFRINLLHKFAKKY